MRLGQLREFDEFRLRCRGRARPGTSPGNRSLPGGSGNVPCRMYSWPRPTAGRFQAPAADKRQAAQLLVAVYEEFMPLPLLLQYCLRIDLPVCGDDSLETANAG